jgi:hypothetical protein
MTEPEGTQETDLEQEQAETSNKIATQATNLLQAASNTVWPDDLVRTLWNGREPNNRWDPLAQHVKRLANDLLAIDRKIAVRQGDMLTLRDKMMAIAEGNEPDGDEGDKEDEDLTPREAAKKRRARFAKMAELLKILGQEERFERDARNKILDNINEIFNEAQNRKVDMLSNVLRAWDIRVRAEERKTREKSGSGLYPTTEELMQMAERR